MPSRILIIDDEWMIARALSARLGAFGFEIKAAADGMTGLEAARTFVPDVILLDLRMPDIDGYEVLRRLRADSRLAEIPVLILTANVQDTVRQEAQVLGAAGFFCKPYDPKKLVACVNAAIANRNGTQSGVTT